MLLVFNSEFAKLLNFEFLKFLSKIDNNDKIKKLLSFKLKYLKLIITYTYITPIYFSIQNKKYNSIEKRKIFS